MGGNFSIRARFFLFLFMPLIYFQCLAIGTDTLSSNGSIRDGDVLVSANRFFRLEFFNIDGDGIDGFCRYVGILYASEFERRIVWVANRENGILGTSGNLTLTANGSLEVSDGTIVVWSTIVNAAQPTNGSTLKLENNGNLVVIEADSGAVLWESFDHPCNTLLPGMKVGINLRTGSRRMLTAWRSDNDPAPGIYSFGADPQDLNQFFIWRRTTPNTRVIFWNGSSFNGFGSSEPIDSLIENASVARGHDEVYLTISPSFGQLSWVVIEPSGTLTNYLAWQDGAEQIRVSTTTNSCSDVSCGPQSSCNENEEPICKCFPGYKPISPAEWNSGAYITGCSPDFNCTAEDGYLTLKKAKLPSKGMNFYQSNASMCRQDCDDIGCSCRAWAIVEDNSCGLCTEDLKGLIEDADDDIGTGPVLSELNIRVASSLVSREGRRCGNCGTNIIPYPLSTKPTCGDPSYGSFFCNSSSGLLYFHVSNDSSYIISSINPKTRTFVIKPQGIDLCWAGSAQRMDIHLNSSLPFHISNNNTVLLLNCSGVTPEKMLHLNCSSSNPCYRYIQEGRAPCFHSKKCCSYSTQGSNSNTSHSIGVLESGCGSYASILNLDVWKDGVQIEWDAPPEPVCASNKDCNGWPNSSCRVQKPDILGKRCFCNENFLWDRLSMNCKPDPHGTRQTSLSQDPHGTRQRDGDHSRFNGDKLLVSLISTTIPGTILSSAVIYYLWKKRNAKGRPKKWSFFPNESIDVANISDNLDVPFIEFECLVKATDNFSNSNKLGRGGFGIVYKGTYLGQEIAVKRLSKGSGQGLEEFKNEVVLIAKLQHKNLVRIQGHCIQGFEKMLVYEYMPNKSLDFFLFQATQRSVLDWEKRNNIIMGIARGLLYLHEDSRLRIIHRDLKTSNILLDKDMNPKISDFGMARIVGEDQIQEITNRVVGTYGYISPEYAANGLYSIKSDVYSFGIIVLEIISGKRNADFAQYENASSLTAYAWHLWKEDRGLELMDPSLRETCNEVKVLKCIHVGLLCVQDNASDRPCMSSVIAMLDNESPRLPPPNQPAFFRGFLLAPPSSSFHGMPIFSNNGVTISTLEAR